MHDAGEPTSIPSALSRAFAQHQRFLWGLCYRMSGSGADADDLVQETFERALRHPPPDTDRALRPWLVRVAMNACRDHLRRRRSQHYTGPWLPGPIETPPDHPDWQGAESAEARYGRLESVSFAFLRAAEALTPSQRAVLLLRDVLDYSVRETAEALDMREANVKTTHHRARRAMASYDASRQPLTPAHRARALLALRAFLMHVTTNNRDALRALLEEDVVMLNDSDGEFFAARRPVVGYDKVVTFARKTKRWGRARIAVLNGVPALVARLPDGKPGLAPRVVMWVELGERGRVAEVHCIVATRKLASLGFDALPRLSLRDVLDGARAALATPGPRHWWLPAIRRLARAGLARLLRQRREPARRA